MALRLADGRAAWLAARDARGGAARHDPRRRLLQHLAARRRPGAGGRGAERLPPARGVARKPGRLHGSAGRARGVAGGKRRHRRHLRRLLPHRPGCRAETVEGWD